MGTLTQQEIRSQAAKKAAITKKINSLNERIYQNSLLTKNQKKENACIEYAKNHKYKKAKTPKYVECKVRDLSNFVEGLNSSGDVSTRFGKILLNIECQREYVWTSKIVNKFANTLFMGRHIPDITLTVFDQVGVDKFALGQSIGIIKCVDGKQRITTLLKILFDEVTFQGNFIENDDGSLSCNEDPINFVHNKKFSEVQKQFPEMAETFLNTTIKFCVEFVKDEKEENEIFAYLNSGSMKVNASDLLWTQFGDYDISQSIKSFIKSPMYKEFYGVKKPHPKKDFLGVVEQISCCENYLDGFGDDTALKFLSKRVTETSASGEQIKREARLAQAYKTFDRIFKDATYEKCVSVKGATEKNG